MIRTPNNLQNWPLKRLGDVAKTSSGGTPNRGESKFYGGTIPWIKSGELGDRTVYESDEHITEAGLSSSSAKLFPAGTLCVALYGATVGKLGILGLDAATNQAVCGIFLPETLNTRFVYRFLESKRQDLLDLAKGGAQPNISQDIIRNLQLPMPSVDVQARLVEEIETQLSRLEAGVSALKRAQANLKRYRAAVLKAACEGRLVPQEADLARANQLDYESGEQLLTRILLMRKLQWSGRGKYKSAQPAIYQGLETLPEGWVWASVEQLTSKVVDGVHKKPTYVPAGVPFVTVRNLTAGPGISFTKLNYISEEDHIEFIKRANPERGDVLVSKDGTLGVIRVIETATIFSIFVSVAMIKPVERSMGRYLGHALSSPQLQRQMVPKGSGLQHIHLEDLREDCVPVPPLAEQERIVAEVERHLSVADQLETTITANLKRATRLRQSILHRAFSDAG